jgi:hypothetical protein
MMKTPHRMGCQVMETLTIASAVARCIVVLRLKAARRARVGGREFGHGGAFGIRGCGGISLYQSRPWNAHPSRAFRVPRAGRATSPLEPADSEPLVRWCGRGATGEPSLTSKQQSSSRSSAPRPGAAAHRLPPANIAPRDRAPPKRAGACPPLRRLHPSARR